MAVQDFYPTQVAVDPENEILIKDAVFQVFAKDDLDRSDPLRVFEAASGEEIIDLRSSNLALVPELRVEGDPAEAVFKSGNFEVLVQSKFGVLYEFGLTPENIAAAVAAPEAAAEAGAAQVAIASTHAASASSSATLAGERAESALTAAGQAGIARDAAVEAAESIQRDEPNGVAPLDGSKKVPDTNLPERLSVAGLSSTIAEALDGFTVADPRLEAFKSALDGGRSAAVWFTGDSTVDWNGTIDPTTRLAQNIAAAYPSHRVCFLARDDAADTWAAPVVVQAGPSGRRHVALTGVRGMRWRGSVAQRTITNQLDVRMLVAADQWTGGGTETLLGSSETTSAGLAWEVRRKGATLSLRVSTNGTSFGTDKDSTAPVPTADGGWIGLRWTMTLDGTNITTTFYTSPENDFATWTQLGSPIVGASAATTIALPTTNGAFILGSRGWQPAAETFRGKIARVEVRASTAVNAPILNPVLPELWERYPEGGGGSFGGSPTVWIINAARSGQNMAYHTDVARLAFETPDFGQSVLVFSDSHNEVGASGKIAWIDPYKAWVDAVRARLPLAAVAVVKQNPHTSAWANEAAYGASHEVRLSELGQLAAREGWSLIDLFAAFKQDPRGLGQLISSDGLHPTPLGYQFSGDEYTRALGIPVMA